jgi:ubiquinone/menaquinone biosynthesis C-methylase UbiE
MSSIDQFDPVNAATFADVPYLRDGIYRDLDIPLTLDYMTRRYVAPVGRHIDLTTAVVADCAAGFGWLSFAFLRAGARHAILLDLDEPRMDAAREIADRLGLADRCEFVVAQLQDTPLAADSVDVYASIETLEHVGASNIRSGVAAIARCARQAVVLTTPNFLFPVVSHDTRLPAAHWLPPGVRHAYARAAGRGDQDDGNVFAKPWDLRPLMRKFRPISRYQTFETLAEFDRFYPHYLPYGPADSGRQRSAPKRGQRVLHAALGNGLGCWSFALAPNLASIWCRR